MAVHRIAAIPGDGIGQEVIAAGLEVLEALQARDARAAPRGDSVRLGLGILSPARPHDARGRPRSAARVRCHLFRRGRRARHSGRRHALGPPPRDLPGLRSVRERAPGAAAARRDQPAARRPAGRPRLDRRAREHRGRVRRRRRPGASRPARGGRHRARGVHPRRLRPDHALCLRAGAHAAAGAGSPWSPSRTPSATAWCCGTRPSPRWRASSRTWRPTRSWSTP